MKKNILFAKKAGLLACRKQRSASRLSLKLLFAAMEGDEARVSSLLALGASTSQQHCLKFENGDTIMLNALMAASLAGQAQCIGLILPSSDVAAVSEADSSQRILSGVGYDALSFAITSRCPQAIDALIPLANMQSIDAHGCSALAIAALLRIPKAVRAMIERGWPLDQLSSSGENILMLAVRGATGSPEAGAAEDEADTVNALLSFMAPSLVDARNAEGHTAFMLSIIHGLNASFDALWTPASQAMATPDGLCGAMLAICHNRPDFFARMLPFADMQRKAENGWTCLEFTARYCRVECLKAFLNAGIDICPRFERIDNQFDQGHNALTAIVLCSTAIGGQTPEFLAKDDADVLSAVALLAPIGTLSRDVTYNGMNALMFALLLAIDNRSRLGAQMARLILPFSDLSGVDAQGDNPLFIAISHIAAQEASASATDAFSSDPLFNEILSLVDLLCASLATKAGSLFEETALMRAARVGASKDVVDVLLRHFDPRAWRVSLDAPFSARQTAAQIAIMHERPGPLMAIASAMSPFERAPASHGFDPMPSMVEFALERAKARMDSQMPFAHVALDSLFALDWDEFEPSADFAVLALASGHEGWALRALDAIDISTLAGTSARCYAARMESVACLDRLSCLAGQESWLGGLSPLGWAARSARPECLARLLGSPCPPSGDCHGAPPLELIFADALSYDSSTGYAERQAACVEILLAAGSGGEVKAFHAALRHKNMAAAGTLAAKAFLIEGLPVLTDLVKSGGASMAKALADAGAVNGVDPAGLDIFDCVFLRYKNTPMSFPEFRADILSLVDTFGINSPIAAAPLAQRVRALGGGGPDGPKALGLALDILAEAEALRKSCANPLSPSRPPLRL